MSYNLMSGNVNFVGTQQGTVEDLVDTHTTQTITGGKTFNILTGSRTYITNTLSVATHEVDHAICVTGDISASLNISASAFYGDGSNLSNIDQVVTTYSNGSNNRVITSTGTTGLNGEASLTFNGSVLTVTGAVSASSNISGSGFYGAWEGDTILGSKIQLASGKGIQNDSGLALDVPNLGSVTPVAANSIIVDQGSGAKRCTITALKGIMPVANLSNAGTVDRIITSNGADDLNAEQHLLFNNTNGLTVGNSLQISGSGKIKAHSHISGAADLVVLGDITGSAIELDDYIVHSGDDNTYFGFQMNDLWTVIAGGDQMITAYGNLSTKQVQVNNSDFKVNTSGLDFWITGSTGYVGIGVADPDSPLEVLSTAAQLKLSYDAANAAQFTVASNGNLTINPNGSTTVNSALLINGNTTLGDASGDNLTITGNVISIPNDININTGHMYMDQSEKRTGFGTAVPEHTLSVSGTVGISGSINLKNPTSGSIAGAGSYLGLNAAGNIILTSSSGGGGGAVSAVANGSDNRISTFSSADALNGEANLTFDGSLLTVNGNITGSGNLLINNDVSASNAFFVDATNQRVGILNNAPSYTLDVEGQARINNTLHVAEYIQHEGDPDTRIKFLNDQIYFEAGGISMLKLYENGSQDMVVFGEAGSLDIDFRVESNGETHMFFIDAGNNRVSIGDSDDVPAATLEVTNHASAGATGVPLMQLNSNDVDQITLDINAANTTSNVIDVTANAMLTGSAFAAISSNNTLGSTPLILSGTYSGNSTQQASLVKLSNENSAATQLTPIHIVNSATTTNGTKIMQAEMGANGSQISLKVKEQLVSVTTSGTTTTVSNFIPQNSIPISLALRVTTLITNNGYITQVGVNTDLDSFGASFPDGNLEDAGDNVAMSWHNKAGGSGGEMYFSAAKDLTITHNAQPSAGQVRLALYYWDITPPQS